MIGFLANWSRAVHKWVIGQSGTGKSRALVSWILQDIVAGRGVGVIDPHGELFDHILNRVARVVQQRPDLAERVVIIDPCDPNWAVGFNPLQSMPGMPAERLAWFLTDVVLKIWGMDSSSAPRMVWLLVNSFLALSDLGLTLVDLPRFLRDAMWRNSLIPKLTNSQAQAYFLTDFPKTESAINQWVLPVLNKIGAFIFDPDVRAIVGQRESTINFREILDHQLVVLINLPKGIMGEENSRLLAAFIVAQFQKAALARADSSQRQPFYLYLDEFQNYTTDNIEDILSESRKYGLSLTVAHQYLAQLTPNLRDGLMNNAGLIVPFRTGHKDEVELSKEIFPTPMSTSHKELNVFFAGGWPVPWYETKKENLSTAEIAGLLTQLQQREFWMKRRGVKWPTRHRALHVADPVVTPEVREAIDRLIAVSGSRYGTRNHDTAQVEVASLPLAVAGVPAVGWDLADTGSYYD